MQTTVRFAPSPTGYLHVGNARIALLNWLFAQKQRGRFLLRFDDTDKDRTKDEYKDAIREDLSWLGLEWSGELSQHDRMDLYAKSIEKLKEGGYLYPCFETLDELNLQRKLLISQGLPPLYDRTKALAYTKDDIEKRINEGSMPHWRFRLHQDALTWQDLVRGKVHFETLKISDPVVIRADGCPLYTLTSVIDDIETGITHVVRGEDHVVNTAVQLQIFAALRSTPPMFAHISLMMDSHGKPLSKRIDSLSLRKMREQGMFPHAITTYLAHLGTNKTAHSHEPLEEMVVHFDFSHFGRAAPNFDEHALATLNRNILQNLTFSEVQSFLPQVTDEALWQTIRHNITSKQQIKEWIAVLSSELPTKKYVTTDEDERIYLQQALSLLPNEGWEQQTNDAGVWSLWYKRLRETSGRKGRQLLLPIRMALTGMKEGPELPALLQYLGYHRVVLRLQQTTRK